MAGKPRVYEAEMDGLNQWVVAAPNQKQALAALGVHQNLFAQGLAHATKDSAAIKAAAAAPGVALRRPKGSSEPFRPATETDASGWSRAAKAVGARSPTRTRPKPDRRALDKAEAELAIFEEKAKMWIAELDREAEALDDRRRQAESEIERRRTELEGLRDRARRAFERR
jgi:hypothetical protein